MPVRILSFNTHGGRGLWGRRDFSRLNALLDAENIDIGVFQEIETRTSRGGAIADIEKIAGPSRPHHLPGLAMEEEGGGWYGNLIVSRHPILRGLVHNLETSLKFEPRNAVDAVIETPQGPLRIIGTHLSLSPIERMSEVKTLVRLIDAVERNEEQPMLLMGDINEWRGRSRLLAHLDELLTPLACGKTFPSFFPVFRLDRVWSHNMRGQVNAQVLDTKETRKMSDHLPLLIEIG